MKVQRDRRVYDALLFFSFSKNSLFLNEEARVTRSLSWCVPRSRGRSYITNGSPLGQTDTQTQTVGRSVGRSWRKRLTSGVADVSHHMRLVASWPPNGVDE